jgi:hypothetical protein
MRIMLINDQQPQSVRQSQPVPAIDGSGRVPPPGVVFKTVIPVRLIEPDGEHGVAGTTPADHAAPRSVATGATDDYPRCHHVVCPTINDALAYRRRWGIVDPVIDTEFSAEDPLIVLAWLRGLTQKIPIALA